MRPATQQAAAAILSAVLSFTACRSASQAPAPRSGAPDPSFAAKELFASHYDFYYEDPVRCQSLLTPRLFRILKHHYEAFERTRQIGALSYDPWTGAQDGEISKPYSFATLKSGESQAVVQFKYTFDLGPETRHSQSVLIKFECPSPGSKWQLSDLVMPNNESLLGLLERNP